MNRPLNRWDVADPEQTLDEINARKRPRVGDVIVALVRRPGGGASEIVDVTVIHSAGRLLDEQEASGLIRRHALATASQAARGRGKRTPVDHLFVTVVCRAGRVLPGPTKLFWWRAWRYSNHLTDTTVGEIYILTEHGWTGLHDRRSGFTPALTPSAGQRLTTVR